MTIKTLLFVNKLHHTKPRLWSGHWRVAKLPYNLLRTNTTLHYDTSVLKQLRKVWIMAIYFSIFCLYISPSWFFACQLGKESAQSNIKDNWLQGKSINGGVSTQNLLWGQCRLKSPNGSAPNQVTDWVIHYQTWVQPTCEHVTLQAWSRHISPAGIFSPERHWIRHLHLFFFFYCLKVQDWNIHHTKVLITQVHLSTDSPERPCSPSDLIPSSERSFPEDSRVPGSVRCVLGDFQDRQEDKLQKSSFLKQFLLKPHPF